jgi:molybdenum cofactor guanylyltransferase
MANAPLPCTIGGYVLAGGRSSRMEADKTLLPLAGRPLIEHAVTKLRRITPDVHILAGAENSHSALSQYAPLVPDIHPGCGPVGGMEAALTHSPHDWNLFLNVDMPFLPTACIYGWTLGWTISALFPIDTPGICMFNTNGRPQPGFCLLHKRVLPFFSDAIGRGEYKLMQVFEQVGKGLPSGLSNTPVSGVPTGGRTTSPAGEPWEILTDTQRANQDLWFLNLNTPQDFALAGANVAALDT